MSSKGRICKFVKWHIPPLEPTGAIVLCKSQQIRRLRIRSNRMSGQCLVKVGPPSAKLAQHLDSNAALCNVSCIVCGHLFVYINQDGRHRAHQTRDVDQCWFNVGPASKTLAQHQTNIGPQSAKGWTGPNLQRRPASRPAYTRLNKGATPIIACSIRHFYDVYIWNSPPGSGSGCHGYG